MPYKLSFGGRSGIKISIHPVESTNCSLPDSGEVCMQKGQAFQNVS